ncbi:MAG: SpoIIE family protein phosphatase, partial [Rhodocyclaceae bacterium]|nr:SpoIIE family protein phosphatase [Rhodocyclaceae bacterium]
MNNPSPEHDDIALAHHLMARLIDAERLNDPAIRHWLLPSSDLSGDLLLAARTPGGTLHLLLADGTGRGLSAPLNAMPVAPPFYRMTEKGFGIEAIARELNAKVHQFLPVNRFIAATLASVDFRSRTVQIWNGGNPPPCLIDFDGHTACIFNKTHMALGILEEAEFNATTETHVFSARPQLILYSDGLLKAERVDGEPFGQERLIAALSDALPRTRYDTLVAALTRHVEGTSIRDDASFALIDCARRNWEMAVEVAVPHLPIPARDVPGAWRFFLRLSAKEIRTIDIVPVLLGLTAQLEGLGADTDRLFVVLSEMYNNAVDHGLLRLDSHLKLAENGIETWITEREQALSQLMTGEIQFDLERFVETDRSWLRIACRDSGPGFDPALLVGEAASTEDLTAAPPGPLPFGRGMLLLRSLCTNFQHNEAGNVA